MRTELLSAYAPEAAFPCHAEETVRAADVPLHAHRDFTEVTFVRVRTRSRGGSQYADEARQGARFYRDLYVGIVGKTYDEEYLLPWEEEE